MARVAVEAKEELAGVDSDLPQACMQPAGSNLLPDIEHFLGARRINVELAILVAQIGGVGIGDYLDHPAMQPRQARAVLVGHPIIVVAIHPDELGLDMARQLVGSVPDYL